MPELQKPQHLQSARCVLLCVLLASLLTLRKLQILYWKHRKVQIQRQYRECKADILCLQEVDLFKDFHQEQLESLGYTTIFQRRRGEKPDGVVIAWRKDLFALANLAGSTQNSSQVVDFDDLATPQFVKESDSWKFQRNNVGLIVALTHKPTGRVCACVSLCFVAFSALVLTFCVCSQCLVVGNVHLYYNPLYEYVKLIQVCSLCVYF